MIVNSKQSGEKERIIWIIIKGKGNKSSGSKSKETLDRIWWEKGNKARIDW